MTVFDGARNMDVLLTTGAVTQPRRRSAWRPAWRLYGPFLLMALAAGLYLGTLLAAEFG